MKIARAVGYGVCIGALIGVVIQVASITVFARNCKRQGGDFALSWSAAVCFYGFAPSPAPETPHDR